MIFLTKEEDLDLSAKKRALYFYASWMPYHKKMLVMIDKMENKYPDMKFFAIDVNAFPNLCKRFTIDSVPMVLIFNERKTRRIAGLVLTSAFRSTFADICN